MFCPKIVCIECKIEAKTELIDTSTHRITCLGPCGIVLIIDDTKSHIFGHERFTFPYEEIKKLLTDVGVPQQPTSDTPLDDEPTQVICGIYGFAFVRRESVSSD